MAFCTNCGTKVDDGVRFCPACGTALATAAPAQPDPALSTAPVEAEENIWVEEPAQAEESIWVDDPVQVEEHAQPKPPKKSKLPLILGIAATAAVVVVGVIITVAMLLIKNLGGATADNPDLGLYNATSAEMYGVVVEIDDLWENGFAIELKDKNKCDIFVDGQSSSGKWQLNGDQVHINGGGLDCDGMLSDGQMALEDVLGTGMTLTFVREGRELSPLPGTDTALPESNSGSDPSQWNDLQQQWNGVWYGVLQLTDCTGKYEPFAYTTYDIYLDVAVDAAGGGEYRLYDADELIGAATCQAQEGVLNTAEGVVFGQDMYPHNWMFLPDRNFDNTYCMTDEITDADGDVVSLGLWIKPWGESWQDQIDSDFYAYPPNHDAYMAMVNAGQKPNLGSAVAQPSEDVQGGLVAPSGTGLTGPTVVYDVISTGEIVMEYPTDTFYEDETAILSTIRAMDDSVKISMVTLLSADAVQSDVESLRSYSDYPEYSKSELLLGGFEVTCITYYDDFFGYEADFVVDLGQGVNGVYGIKFMAVSDYSMDDALSDEVLTILDTVRIV